MIFIDFKQFTICTIYGVLCVKNVNVVPRLIVNGNSNGERKHTKPVT